MYKTFSNKKIKNQKFDVYQDNEQYYLRLDFDYEDDYGFYKGHIDRIKFDFYLDHIEVKGDIIQNAQVKFYKPSEGYNNPISFDILADSKGNLFTVELVKEKTYEMTIEEIEKKLGHKVKIVSKSKEV